MHTLILDDWERTKKQIFLLAEEMHKSKCGAQTILGAVFVHQPRTEKEPCRIGHGEDRRGITDLAAALHFVRSSYPARSTSRVGKFWLQQSEQGRAGSELQ